MSNNLRTFTGGRNDQRLCGRCGCPWHGDVACTGSSHTGLVCPGAVTVGIFTNELLSQLCMLQVQTNARLDKLIEQTDPDQRSRIKLVDR